jgi:hypothetical protein
LREVIDMKDICSVIAVFIAGGCCGTLLGVWIVAERLHNYGRFRWGSKVYSIKEEVK